MVPAGAVGANWAEARKNPREEASSRPLLSLYGAYLWEQRVFTLHSLGSQNGSAGRQPALLEGT